MFFNRNNPDNLDDDYEDSMDSRIDEQNGPQRSYGYNPQAKINAMQKVINALNENIGSIKGQLAGQAASQPVRHSSARKDRAGIQGKGTRNQCRTTKQGP